MKLWQLRTRGAHRPGQHRVGAPVRTTTVAVDPWPLAPLVPSNVNTGAPAIYAATTLIPRVRDAR